MSEENAYNEYLKQVYGEILEAVERRNFHGANEEEVQKLKDDYAIRLLSEHLLGDSKENLAEDDDDNQSTNPLYEIMMLGISLIKAVALIIMLLYLVNLVKLLL